MVQAPPQAQPRYYFDIQQGTDEWHALRRGVITASAIGKLLTATGKPANNDTSRAQLYQLLAERVTGESDQGFYNDDMARGHLLEPYARDLYAKNFDPVAECGFITLTTSAGTLGYSPDGLVGDDGLIEIKCPRPKTHLKSLLTGVLPVEYVPQVQTGLVVTGRRWCDYISYSPGLPLFVQRCGPELAVHEQIFAAHEAAERQLDQLMADYRNAAAKFPATELVEVKIPPRTRAAALAAGIDPDSIELF
jgi:putative phage-type endonuclease